MKVSVFNCFRAGLIVAAELVASGCASTPNILADYDRSVDFGEYHTYDFFEDAGPDGGSYQSLFTKYMKEAIEIEMEKRGYSKAEDPDLLVNFNAIIQEKTKVSTRPAQPNVGMGYYGYRGGYYGTWGGYNYGTETHVSQYNEGTFNIDVVDSKRNQLVWEAVGIGRVSQKDLTKMRSIVMEGVPKFFSGYPFVAGQSAPVVEAD